MASSAVIRRARLEDAAAVAAVHTASWQETYAREVPAEALSGLQFDAAEWTQRIREVSASQSLMAIWVAETDDGIVGFAAVGPDPDFEEDGEEAIGDRSPSLRTGRLYSIYLLGSAQGTGVGRRLHAAALGSLAEAGFAEATLWVSRRNAAAIRFYELADWQADGASRVEEVAGVSIPVVRYRIALSQPSSSVL